MTSWNNLSIASGSLSERLIRMIADGELAAGAELPNERELAESTGISRTSVREALRGLEVANEWMAPSRPTALQTTTRLEQSVAAHRKIYETIRTHDPDGARAAMAEHIHEVFHNIGIDRWTS